MLLGIFWQLFSRDRQDSDVVHHKFFNELRFQLGVHSLRCSSNDIFSNDLNQSEIDFLLIFLNIL